MGRIRERALGAGLTTTIAMALLAASAAADTIAPTVTTDDFIVNGNCTLREAVEAANTNLPVDSCPGGGAGDEIRLNATGPYLLQIAPAGGPPNHTGDIVLAGTNEIRGINNQVTIQQTMADRVITNAAASDLTLNNLRLTGGMAGIGDGGAVQSTGTSLNLSGVAFEGNHAAGGGAVVTTGNVSAEGVRFLNNEADLNDGGALKILGGTTGITESSFEGNEALDEGGAIDARSGGHLGVSETTFTGNSANVGAAINTAADALPGQMFDATIAGNIAKTTGGGAVTTLDATDLPVSSTILAYNTGPAGAQSNCGTNLLGSFTNAYNLVDVNDCGLTAGVSNNILGVDPQLSPPVLIGGTLVARPPFTGSPAVDAIPTGLCPSSQDQVGTVRPVGGGCDIGAFEGSVPKPIVGGICPNGGPAPCATTTTPKKKCKKPKKKTKTALKKFKKCKKKRKK
jgi:CSLREA domain-containing protein